MRARGANERGMSLIEVLVATAILSVAIVVALTVYDASRKAFSKGENATEQQESVRIAFDLMTSQIRMLGFNVNPDGDPGRPDEQLEGALDHAVVFRGDFDRSDATASGTPETALAGGAFRAVSTGNDEIVAYVLSKPDGTGPDTITFQADVRESPRDGDVEPVSIGNVVLNPTAPPYTLYRVTLNNDAATYGGSAFVVRTPVVENVRDLSFTYYGARGVFKDASATIPETAATRAMRGGLTRVNVSLVGMTRQQDLAYNDPTDAAAPHYRKFELKGDVTPRNMRFRGIQDLNADVTPPTKPATPTLTPGHCGGLLVSWAGNPPSEGVTQYRVNWRLSAGAVPGSRNLSGSPLFLDQLTTGSTYFVSVQAQDAQGNTSVESDSASATTVNLNTPSVPTDVTTTTDLPYRVSVSWMPVTANTANVPAADPLAPRIRDLAGYRIYGDPDPTRPFSREDWSHFADERVLSPSFQPPFDVRSVVACQDFYYRVVAVDTCGLEGAPTPVSRGRVGNSGVKPKPPTEVTVQLVGPLTARVRWRRITHDLNNQYVRIEHYRIFRSLPINRSLPSSSAVWGPAPIADVYAVRAYTDNALPALEADEVVYYRITGADECVNESDPSVEASVECAFSGEVEFVAPVDGQAVQSVAPVTVRVAGGTDTYTNVVIRYEHSANGLTRTFTSSAPATIWTDSGWTALPRGDYTIKASVTNATGCTQSTSVDVRSTVAVAPD